VLQKNWLYKMKDLFQVSSKNHGEILNSQLGHAKFLSLHAFAVCQTKLAAKVFFEIDNVIIDANLIKDSLQRQVYLVVRGRQLFG